MIEVLIGKKEILLHFYSKSLTLLFDLGSWLFAL